MQRWSKTATRSRQSAMPAISTGCLPASLPSRRLRSVSVLRPKPPEAARLRAPRGDESARGQVVVYPGGVEPRVVPGQLLQLDSRLERIAQGLARQAEQV